MGDIKPKRNQPKPNLDPITDPALGENPGSSVTMPEIPGWNAEAPEPTTPPKGYFPPVDLIEAWRRMAAAAQPQPVPAAPAEQPAEAEPVPESAPHHAPVSNRLLILLTALGVLVVAGLGGTYFLFFRSPPAPEQAPVAVPTSSSTPYSPKPRPTYSPNNLPTTPGQPAPAPQPGAPRTYTVKPGDTLITIGEQLGVDWQRIAAANGQISDPNLILPGQVLTIP